MSNKKTGGFRDKLANAFNRCFFVFYTGLFLLTGVAGMVTVAVFGELGTEFPMPVFIVILRFLAMLAAFAVIAVFFIAFARFLLSDKTQGLDDRKRNTLLIFAGVGLILIIQLVFAFCLQMKPVTDISKIDSYAKTIVTENSFDCLEADINNHYIIRYQNNLPILLLITLVYKTTYALTGSFSYIPIIILNTLALNAAVLLTALTARRVFGGRKALLTLLLCALFTPYYTYTPYFYTDSFSIPFLIGTVYAFVSAVQSSSRGKKIILFLLSGALCFIGFKIKASVIILIPALLIYLLLRYGIKRAAKMGGSVLLSFCVLYASVTAVSKAAPLISEQASDRYQFTPAHWIMMGLKDLGAFNFDDSDFSQSFTTKSERREANINEIVKRVSEKGIGGMIVHLGTKAAWTYMDGTYYITYYLENFEHWTPLHSFIMFNGRFRFAFCVYNFGYQMFLMAMIAYSGLHARRRKDVGITTLFRIAVFGMVLFFLIWEANSRYPFNFTPLYMLLATYGIFGFAERHFIPRPQKNKKSP